MLRFLVVALLVAFSSAFQIASLSRRDFARAIATAPLAAATAAFADADNKYLGTSPAGLGKGNVDTYGSVTKSIGREATIDEIGGAAIPKKALKTSSDYAFKLSRPGEGEKNDAQKTAFARLLK